MRTSRHLIEITRIYHPAGSAFIEDEINDIFGLPFLCENPEYPDAESAISEESDNGKFYALTDFYVFHMREICNGGPVKDDVLSYEIDSVGVESLLTTEQLQEISKLCDQIEGQSLLGDKLPWIDVVTVWEYKSWINRRYEFEESNSSFKYIGPLDWSSIEPLEDNG